MQQPPRPAGEGVLTRRMWRGIVFVGVIMAIGTLFALDASLPGGFIDQVLVSCGMRRRWRLRR